MFSTLDNHDQRFLRVTVEFEDGTTEPVRARSLLSDPWEHRAIAAAARAHPTERRVVRFATTLVDDRLVRVGGSVRPYSRLDDPEADEWEDIDRPAAVHIEVHRIAFDRGASTVKPSLVTSRTVRP